MVARMKAVRTPKMLRRALDIVSRGNRTPFCCFFLLFSSLSPSSLLCLSFPLHSLPHLYPSSSSSSSYFYYKPLGGLCTQLRHRFVEQQDVFFYSPKFKICSPSKLDKIGKQVVSKNIILDKENS